MQASLRAVAARFAAGLSLGRPPCSTGHLKRGLSVASRDSATHPVARAEEKEDLSEEEARFFNATVLKQMQKLMVNAADDAGIGSLPADLAVDETQNTLSKTQQKKLRRKARESFEKQELLRVVNGTSVLSKTQQKRLRWKARVNLLELVDNGTSAKTINRDGQSRRLSPILTPIVGPILRRFSNCLSVRESRESSEN
ncbi:hypothetical protein C8F04DRAFT_625866 [Mycena alexandri]|uniref:Uncharacterized protein n=1 Tax=Mycena alexandri TaxID=1745969 RepID=A0AAD6STN9_9AGAR|nr:hypothetical protein C8F04DRAFT_625866 [Mycena alexandri]